MATERSEILDPIPGNPVCPDQKAEGFSRKGEIDTSSPFKSVKEAANRFGGMGFWKPFPHKPSENDSQGIMKVEELAAKLEKDLLMKERETFDVLKELDTTKNMAEQLKLKLQKEASEDSATLDTSPALLNINEICGFDPCPSEAPGFILLELKRAKLNLTRTTNGIADIRAAVDFYNREIYEQRKSLEKTRQRLSSNTSKITHLEEELNEARRKLELVKDTDTLQKYLSLEVWEIARSEVSSAMSEIEETKTMIKTAEIRLAAAKKMKQAASTSEAVALSEIKALLTNNEDTLLITITSEEYSSLVSKGRDAEQACNNSVVDVIDEAKVSHTEILKKVETAREEFKMSKRALEEALSRVEIANRGKLAVEEALRKWRWEHGQLGRSFVHNSTKFKNSRSSLLHRKESLINDLNLADNELQEAEDENGVQREESMDGLSKANGDPHSAKKYGKENV